MQTVREVKADTKLYNWEMKYDKTEGKNVYYILLNLHLYQPTSLTKKS